jgi:hypothetical protein
MLEPNWDSAKYLLKKRPRLSQQQPPKKNIIPTEIQLWEMHEKGKCLRYGKRAPNVIS